MPDILTIVSLFAFFISTLKNAFKDTPSFLVKPGMF